MMPTDDHDDFVAVPDMTHGGWYVYCPPEDNGPIAWFPSRRRAEAWIGRILNREAGVLTSKIDVPAKDTVNPESN